MPRQPLHGGSDSALRAPHPLLMLLEARAPLEYVARLAASPLLKRLPAGDGHPVIVFPGLIGNDVTTAPLRSFLRKRGYTPCAWQQGFNLGPRRGVLDACSAQVQQVADRHGRKVSFLGWSLGGLYAREMAKLHPQLARCVITLGTPFAGHPRATNAWRLYEFVSGQDAHDPAQLAQIRIAPTCPTTSIYSRSDGIVAWQCSVNPVDAARPLSENIEVQASHIGMGANPLTLFAVADRLAQDPQHWQPFDRSRGVRRWLFGPKPLPAAQAARPAQRAPA